MKYAKSLIARPLNVSSLEDLKWSGSIGSYSLHKASSEAEKSYFEMSVLSAERFNYLKKIEYLEFVFKGHELVYIQELSALTPNTGKNNKSKAGTSFPILLFIS